MASLTSGIVQPAQPTTANIEEDLCTAIASIIAYQRAPLSSHKQTPCLREHRRVAMSQIILPQPSGLRTAVGANRAAKQN